MSEINFEFREKTQRYHYTSGSRKNEFVKQAKIRELIEDWKKGQQDQAEALADQYLKDEITLRQFQEKLAKQSKNYHVTQAKIGKPNLDQSDYGKIGAKLKKEYSYLSNFVDDIDNKNLSDAQIKSRAKQYFMSNESFENAQTQSHKNNDFKWEKWQRTLQDSCAGCIMQGGRGWVRLDTLPRIGSQNCLIRCKCYKEYSKSKVQPI